MLQQIFKPLLADYQTQLEIAAKSMIRFRKPEHLIRMIIRMISEHINVTHAAILLYKQDKNYYKLVESKGKKGMKIPVGFARLDPENPLIRVFADRKNHFINGDGVLSYKDLKAKNPSGLLEEVKRQMEVLGAEICIPSYFKNQLLGILILGEKISGDPLNRKEIGLLLTLANDAAMALSNAQLIENLRHKIDEIEELYKREHRLFINTSIALAAAIDAKDQYTRGHTGRVTKHSLEIFKEIDNKECSEVDLHITALLHDIGKIGIPDVVLHKKGQLNGAERIKMNEHAAIGATILTPIGESGDIVKGVRHHHEKFDGSGYPDGLKGSQIPFIARIIAVADAFDAITTDRPYREKKPIEAAVQEILNNSGTQFDPEVVAAFLRAYEKGKCPV